MKPNGKDKPLIEMTKAELRDAFDSIGLGGNFQMLEEARRGVSECDPMLLAFCILMPQNLIVYADCEYGDGEGIRMIRGWIDEINRSPGLLLPGESLVFKLVKVTAYEEFPTP
jgi:hypothetical protein